MIYIIIIISILVLLIFLFKTFGITIAKAKFENRSSIKVINNSYLDTCKHFVDKADYDYMSGKIIFFNTWASWCGSCMEEIPILNQLQLLYQHHERIIFVSYCNDLKPGSIPAFIKQHNLSLNYRFLNAKEGLRVSLRKILSSGPNPYKIDPSIDSVPMNFIIGEHEKVLYYKRGSLKKDDWVMITSILNGV